MMGQFLWEMVPPVVDLMGHAYPEIREKSVFVQEVVRAEGNRFGKTLDIGLRKLDEDLKSAGYASRETVQGFLREKYAFRRGRDFLERDLLTVADMLLKERESGSREEILKTLAQMYDADAGSRTLKPTDPRAFAEELLREIDATGLLTRRVFAGETAFKLFDTFGLPVDFIEDAARDADLFFDSAGYATAMEEQKTRARASWKGGAGKEAANPAYAKIAETFKTEKDFYHGTSAKDARIEAILTKSGPVSELKAGESGEVVLDRTVIYAESGGQMSDTGAFYDNAGAQLLGEVTGAYYPVAGLVAHRVNAKETLRVGDCVSVVANARTARTHHSQPFGHAPCPCSAA